MCSEFDEESPPASPSLITFDNELADSDDNAPTLPSISFPDFSPGKLHACSLYLLLIYRYIT